MKEYSGRLRSLFWAGMSMITLVAGIACIWWLTRPDTQPTQATTQPQSAVAAAATEHSLTYPLYYPHTLPTGFQYVPSSLSVPEEHVLTFSFVSANGAQITITEQPRPALMEEVKKTKKITTAIGDAYIADLEGRTAGFVLTDKTLIIISPDAKEMNDTILREFMTTLTML